MNVLFVNMAICDILTALTLIPMTVAQYFLQSQMWFSGTFGVVSCKGMSYVGQITIAGSIFSLTLMAIDRYFAICRPISNITFFKRYKIVSALVWVPSIILMLPSAVFANTVFHEGIIICTTDFSDLWKTLFMLELFVVLYVIPLFILAVLYGIIAKELWLNKTSNIITSEEKKLQKREQKKRKLVMMLMIVLGVFAVCWLPVQVFHFFIATGTPMISNYNHVAIWLAQANSAINPFLYIALHSGFRKAFKDCLYKCGFPVKRSSQHEELKNLRPATTRSGSLTTTARI